MPRRKKVENLSLEEMLMKTEQEIKTTEAELKELRLKAKELRKKIEDKQKDEIFSALLASGKTVEEQADQSPADRKDATGSLYLSGGGFQFFPTDHRQCGRDCFGSQGVNCRESLRA